MLTLWVQDLKSDEERRKFKEQVLGSKKVLDKAIEICYNVVKMDESVRTPDYDSPSWSHRQAHQNGKREALELIIKLLTVSDNDL